MSNQLKNEMQLTVSHEDMHRLVESETSEQEVVALNNEELEVVSGARPSKLLTKPIALGVVTGTVLGGAALGVAVKGVVKGTKAVVRAVKSKV